MVLLKAEKLSKTYGATVAALDVDISLYSGKVHALVGENGAGKSTVIRILTGLVHPNSGEIIYDNQLIDLHSPHQARDLGIVAVHQELTLVDNLSIAQNIWLGHEPLTRFGTVSKKLIHDWAIEMITAIGLSLDARLPVSKLSLADKQLVEIVKALSSHPRLLILDEATSALGEKEVDLLHTVVRDLVNKGSAVLFVSHRMNEIFQFCDTCSVMKDGKIVYKDEIVNMDEHLIIEKMTGRELNKSYPTKNTSIKRLKPLLSLKDISTSKGLNGINLELYSGEILGIGGLQGHGQIELLNAIYGLDAKEEGIVFLEDLPVNIHNPYQALKNGIALVPQDRKTEGLFIDRSVEENFIACAFRKCMKFGVLQKHHSRRLIDTGVEKMSIKISSTKQLVRTLSGGNQQKIAIGRWLNLDLKILLLIEPTRGIDIGTKFEIYRILRSLADSGVGILITTNEMVELVGLCDRVLVMFEKRIVQELIGPMITEKNIAYSSFGRSLVGDSK
jgi:ABC-type sugar transport system ATPase subunit